MNIYVGNLPYTVSEDELQELFAQFGAVKSAHIIKDRDTGNSKGFGFVEMETEQAAKEAIERLNNFEFKQRTLKVNEANPPRGRSSGGGGDRRRY